MQALTPLTIGRSSATASLLGALWGFGHSIGQLVLGLLMVILKVSPGPDCNPVHALCSGTHHMVCIRASNACIWTV